MIIVAAGNDRCDSCLQTPSFAPHVITVGASTETDKAAVFSDFGKCVDLYAPGENILSACGGNLCGGQEDRYVEMSGTSMAAPHAAGVAAQLLQMYPDATADEVADMLSCAAVPMVLDIGLDEVKALPSFLLSEKDRKERFKLTSITLDAFYSARNVSKLDYTRQTRKRRTYDSKR